MFAWLFIWQQCCVLGVSGSHPVTIDRAMWNTTLTNRILCFHMSSDIASLKKIWAWLSIFVRIHLSLHWVIKIFSEQLWEYDPLLTTETLLKIFINLQLTQERHSFVEFSFSGNFPMFSAQPYIYYYFFSYHERTYLCFFMSIIIVRFFLHLYLLVHCVHLFR